ncbi:MAG: hypothetical protein RBU45_25850 [Myxococcota bacterium]|jgi:hypothetical protein|nr:hypothetical protein [Myxococcota bacterium]
MKTIDTAHGDWRRALEESMKRREPVTLTTTDEGVAQEFAKRRPRPSVSRLLLLVVGTVLAVLVAAAASVVRLPSGEGPPGIQTVEPAGDLVFVAVAAVALVFAAFFVYRMIKLLVQNRYQFKVETRVGDKSFLISGEPVH